MDFKRYRIFHLDTFINGREAHEQMLRFGIKSLFHFAVGRVFECSYYPTKWVYCDVCKGWTMFHALESAAGECVIYGCFGLVDAEQFNLCAQQLTTGNAKLTEKEKALIHEQIKKDKRRVALGFLHGDIYTYTMDEASCC